MAPHFSTLAWRISWTEEPGRLQSMGLLESDTTEWLHFQFSLSCIGEGNGNPIQCSCLENPRDGGAWWVAVSGVAQSWTRLKRLSSSSSKYHFLSVFPNMFSRAFIFSHSLNITLSFSSMFLDYVSNISPTKVIWFSMHSNSIPPNAVIVIFNPYIIALLYLSQNTSSFQFSHSFVSDSLWLHGLQHARLSCPSPTPEICSNSCSSSWCIF